jgi:Spy/CpxP family protein refolding chaperone
MFKIVIHTLIFAAGLFLSLSYFSHFAKAQSSGKAPGKTMNAPVADTGMSEGTPAPRLSLVAMDSLAFQLVLMPQSLSLTSRQKLVDLSRELAQPSGKQLL